MGRKTVESLITRETRAVLTPQPYYFCDAADCDTVYVSALGDHLIAKDQLTVRVGMKETEDPIPSAIASDMTAGRYGMTSVGVAIPPFRGSLPSASRLENAGSKRPIQAVAVVWEPWPKPSSTPEP